MADAVPKAAGFGPGHNATTFGGGVLPAVRGELRPDEPTAANPPKAAGFGPGPNASTFGDGALPAVRGGLGSAPASTGQLLQAEGFVLVLETGAGERTRFAAADGPAHGLTGLSVTIETNNLSSWSATLPADRELFDFPFADVTIGHNGNRIYHGNLLEVEGSSDDNEVGVSGFGRLWPLTAGHMTFSCAECAGWEALNELWKQIAERTDGEIRGYAVRPPAGTERRIGSEPLVLEGTPLEILKSASGEFGYAFAHDASDRIPVVESFRPGQLSRSASWTSTDHSVALDPESYHNHVVIEGAAKPGVGEQQIENQERYRGEAVAPDSEIDALANGRLITHQPAPDDELTSDEACQTRAQSVLAELRGQYAVTGAVSTVPTGLVPGYQYTVPEFDAAAPPAARPVTATLQSVSHTLVGGASTELDFGTDRGLVGAIRAAAQPAMAQTNVQRTQDGLLGEGTAGGEAAVYAHGYPHEYPGDGEDSGGYGYRYGYNWGY